METSGKVKLKSEPYEYMLYDGENYEKIQEFIGKFEHVDLYHDKCLRFWTDSDVKLVVPGSYFVKDENGIVFIYSEADFKKLFEPWDKKDEIAKLFMMSPRKCLDDECFIMDYPHQMMATEKIPVRKKRSEITEQDDVVKCVICHEPATQLDHLYPNDTMDNRCTKHARSLIDPCAWEDYGTAVEVCKEHYDFLLLAAKIDDILDKILQSDMHLSENVLRDKLIEAGRQLNFFMMAKWPDEQMGPKKEEEAKNDSTERP